MVNSKPIFFRGKRILDAVLDFLKVNHGVAMATEVLLTGGSAACVPARGLYVRSHFGQVVKFGTAPVSVFFYAARHSTGREPIPNQHGVPVPHDELERGRQLALSRGGNAIRAGRGAEVHLRELLVRAHADTNLLHAVVRRRLSDGRHF